MIVACEPGVAVCVIIACGERVVEVVAGRAMSWWRGGQTP